MTDRLQSTFRSRRCAARPDHWIRAGLAVVLLVAGVVPAVSCAACSRGTGNCCIAATSPPEVAGGCCSLAEAAGARPGAATDPGCRCRLEPRDEAPFALDGKTDRPADGLPPTTVAPPVEPVVDDRAVMAPDTAARPPGRPVRILYAVWRN